LQVNNFTQTLLPAHFCCKNNPVLVTAETDYLLKTLFRLLWCCKLSTQTAVTGYQCWAWHSQCLFRQLSFLELLCV